MNQGEEFVTISEAARRLGIAPRQARRYADRLPPQDRREPGDGDRDGEETGTGTTEGRSPLRVRYAALAALRESATAANGAKDTDGDRDRDTERTVLGDVPAVSPPPGELSAAGYQAIIARQEREIEYLREALKREQENLAREQALRLLPAPERPQEAPGEAQEGQQRTRRAWLRWPWRRGKEEA